MEARRHSPQDGRAAEILVGAAFLGGIVLAQVLKRLGGGH